MAGQQENLGANVQRHEFNIYFNILKDGLDKHQVYEAQTNIWFEKVSNWSVTKWRKTVDKLLETCERWPSLATILEIGNSIVEQNTFYKSIGCKKCKNTGVIFAQDNYGEAIFRCNQCKISEDTASLSIPVFSLEFIRLNFIEDSNNIFGVHDDKKSIETPLIEGSIYNEI